jgi:hypothetical protein
MPSIFFSENVIAMTAKFTWMIYKSSAIMRLFFHKFCHFQHAFASAEQDAAYYCCKIPCLDFGAHHVGFVLIRVCKMASR